MEDRGIKFYMKDGSIDYYDPLKESDLKECENHYELHMTYLYDIPKEEVDRYEWYSICEECGYEVYHDGCRNCYDKEL